MINWRASKRRTTQNRSTGYDPESVDDFLTRVGAGLAAGVDPGVLRAAISEVTFPVVRRGYDPNAVDTQLKNIAAQLANDSAPIAAA